MKSYLFISALPFIYFLSTVQTRGDIITAAQWQEDVKYFKEHLVKKHKNAFHHVSKEEFDADVERLYNDIPTLKDYQVVVRLMQITAKVGDGHTGIHLPVNFKTYPIRVNWFGDDLYVIATTAQYKSALGCGIVKIGNANLEEINKKLGSVISQDENKYTMATGSVFLLKPEILVTLGIVPEYDQAHFTLLDPAGKEIELDLRPMSPDVNIPFISASDHSHCFDKR